nr:hypothetical protein [Thioalkalivibrio sp.]
MPTQFHPATIHLGHRVIFLAALSGSLLLMASLAGAANDAEEYDQGGYRENPVR